MSNFVIDRILGRQKKNRTQTRISIEAELLTAIKANCLDINDIANIAIYNYLSKKQTVNLSSSPAPATAQL